MTGVDRRLTPWIQPAAGALQALRNGHIEAAQDLCAAIPFLESDGLAWRGYVKGLLDLHHDNFDAAETHLLTASREAEAFVLSNPTDPEKTDLGRRLAGLCYQRLGDLHRQLGNHRRALSYHGAAYTHRDESGTPGERWETALALHLDHLGSGDQETALEWSLRALDFSEQLGSERARFCAMSWTHVGETLSSLGKHREAVTAALHARGFWETTGTQQQQARADRVLGDAFGAWAETLRGQGETHAAQEKLATSRKHLTRAITGLREAECEAEAAACAKALAALAVSIEALQKLNPQDQNTMTLGGR